MRLLVLRRSPCIGPIEHEMRRRVTAMTAQAEVSVGFLGAWAGAPLFADCSRVHCFQDAEALRAFLAAQRTDVLIACDAPQAYQAIREARYGGVLITELHHLQDSLGTLWDLRGAAPMDGFIVPSGYLADIVRLELRYGDALPVKVVPYGVEGDLFDARPAQAASDRPVILWVGGIEERSNWRGALEIAARLRSKGTDLELWMVGDGAADGDALEALFALVARNDLLDRCRWIGQVDRAQMPRFYSMAADSGGCHLVTALDAPFPVSTLEALACRCPVVACDDGATGEVLGALGDWGLYQPADLGQAAGLIEAVLGDGELRQRVTGSARDAVLERYAAQKVAAAYSQAIRDIAQPRLRAPE